MLIGVTLPARPTRATRPRPPIFCLEFFLSPNLLLDPEKHQSVILPNRLWESEREQKQRWLEIEF